jgi:tetratricopeptide (TPR) repeat protein
MIRVLFALLLLLCMCLPVRAADEEAQIQPQINVLGQIFRLDSSRWEAELAQHRELLDDSFFQRYGARIRWGLENGQREDVLRCLEIVRIASIVVGRPGGDYYKLLFLTESDGRPATILKKLEFNGGLGDELAMIDYHISHPPSPTALLSGRPAQSPPHYTFAADYVEWLPLPEPRPIRLVDACSRTRAYELLTRGVRTELSGRPEEAAQIYRRALATDKNSLQGHVDLGVVCYRLGKLDEAIENLVAAVNLNPYDPQTWRYLGFSYERRYDEGGQRYEDIKLACLAYMFGSQLSFEERTCRVALVRTARKRWARDIQEEKAPREMLRDTLRARPGKADK